jgi:hypothetical protein
MAKMMDNDFVPQATGKNGPVYADFVAKYKPKKGWQRLRLYGLLYQDARHNNIKTKTGKTYAEWCAGYDVDNDQFFADREDRCECCKLGFDTQIRRFVNVLNVDEWDRRPANPPDDWNPFYLLEMSPSLYEQIIRLKSHPQNKSGSNVGDPLKGSIIGVEYKPDAIPAQQYSVSLLEVGWVFTEDMLKFTFPQTTPEGRREVRRGSGNLPAAWTYYPCRNSRDGMVRSLTTHGYYGSKGSSETHADVQSKGLALLGELNNAVSERPRGGVRELTKLREDDAPPPPQPKSAVADIGDIEDSIPF